MHPIAFAPQACRRPRPAPPLQNIRSFLTLIAVATFSVFAGFTPASAPTYKIMLLTGQSSPYHDWTRSPPLAGADMASFAPKFSDYAPFVIVYEGAEWPATGGVVTTSTVNIFIRSR
jgi:hypothetical protein